MSSFVRLACLVVLTIAAFAEKAAATIAVIDVGPGQPGTNTLSFTSGPAESFEIPTGPPCQPQRRDCILNWLIHNRARAVTPLETTRIVVRELSGETGVRWDIGDTASTDRLGGAGVTNGRTHFEGLFDPFDVNLQPAIFTAGIVTDVGELTAQVSSQELNFQTDGPIICQALFQRLAPQAPQYGAQINYAGDRLEVYFDPAYTVTMGGVIFGTSSPSEGCAGTLVTPLPPPPTRVRVGFHDCKEGVNGLRFEQGPAIDQYIVPILVPMDATLRRDTIKLWLDDNTAMESVPLGFETLEIPYLLPSTKVRTEPYDTRTKDSVSAPSPAGGDAHFPGFFQPFAEPGLPAVFTAGIVTDAGELTVQVSAQELNFQTEGPIICQALFQRLAPRAPQYGAQINYAGDRLEVYFDPAYSVTQGGIIFGTTSPTQGCSGGIVLAIPQPLKGDMNCDGVVNIDDAQPFIEALADPDGWLDLYPDCNIMNADMNSDGRIDGDDIRPFIDAIVD